MNDNVYVSPIGCILFLIRSACERCTTSAWYRMLMGYDFNRSCQWITCLPEFWFVDYLTQVFDLVLCIFDGGLYLFEGFLQSIRGWLWCIWGEDPIKLPKACTGWSSFFSDSSLNSVFTLLGFFPLNAMGYGLRKSTWFCGLYRSGIRTSRRVTVLLQQSSKR